MQETPQSQFNDWSPPLSLEGVPLLPWPVDTFPWPFEEFVKELSRSTETPIELSTMLTLATVATAAQKKYQVQIKVDYSEPVNIWPLVILPPASRKSKVFSEVTQSLKDWEFEQKELIETRIKTITSQRKTVEGRIKELRNQAAKAEGNEFQTLQSEIERLETDLEEVPIYPQLWTADVTPEHLGTIMACNDEAMAILSDEGGIFEILGGLYSDGRANIDLFLQAHSANSVRVDRGSRPAVFMQRAVLTMGLAIQPEVIQGMRNSKSFRGRGLLGRFLYALPKSNIGSRTFKENPINPDCKTEFNISIRKILEHPFADTEGEKTQHKLSLSPEAFTKWQEYARAIETMMGEEIGHLSRITDWAGKLPGAIARIAALLHIMRHATQKPWEKPISVEDMSSAIKIGHFLINHALKAFDLLQEPDSIQMARDIYSWIKQEKLQVFTMREVCRKFRKLKKENRGPALDTLVDHEIIREREIYQASKPGRKSDFYEVNPLLIQ